MTIDINSAGDDSAKGEGHQQRLLFAPIPGFFHLHRRGGPLPGKLATPRQSKGP